MQLLILFGPPAVGKMTVGKLVEAQTDYKLFHNHAISDSITHLFGVGSPAENRLSRVIREAVIQEAADAKLNLIFTYMWNFGSERGKQNIDAYKQIYESRGGYVKFVELVSHRSTCALRGLATLAAKHTKNTRPMQRKLLSSKLS